MPVPLLVAAAVVVAAWMVVRLVTRPDVGGAEARELVAGGARLVDVRTPREYAAGHLPGATNVPLDALERRAEELGPRTRPLVVYCESGARSAHAQRLLRRHGFGSVRNLGSWRAWPADSGRIEGGSR
jgi:rhodanese-related sulfurtransferase